MTDAQQRAAAKEFAAFWNGKGYEKGHSQPFWLSLLRDVFGVEHPEGYISFEDQVHIDRSTGFIDGYIPETKVLIEQKSLGKNLNQAIRQSDGSLLTPLQQAKKYIADLPTSQHPRWVITCNFSTFHIYDMEQPNSAPIVVELANLEQDYYLLNILVDTKSDHIHREERVSMEAGEIVGALYDAFLGQYKDPESPETLKSLNVLCVRLVFCLYAEDAGVFGKRNMFHDYLSAYETPHMRRALVELFRVLDTEVDQRDPYLEPELAAFPYVNGGLFEKEDIEIPHFTDEIRELILKQASEDFDWSVISPTIFGAVFESTLNPETRRSGGMHYTSIENIHKVIDPLFLDDLKAELEKIDQLKTVDARKRQSAAFRQKLSRLTFLDPAAGSGNFLTETFLCLRKLENDAIYVSGQLEGQMMLDEGISDPVLVSISQFYGIEINDFAVSVAKTALWIAESQMLRETELLTGKHIDFLPLTTNANIVEGNALRLDWDDVVEHRPINYIMGNPPFVGYSLQSKEQKADILSVYVDETGKPYKAAGKIDYVSGWYFKASEFASTPPPLEKSGIPTRIAFVSTNSITQGEQVAAVWKPLYERFGIHIDFAHRTFRWDSEANIKAHVHCVIVGFSVAPNPKSRQLYSSDQMQVVSNINAYLMEAPNVFIQSRKKPLFEVPEMTTGNRPADGGHLIIEADEYDDFIKKEPKAEQYIKKLIGSAEFINNKKRWCLWLIGISPAELRNMPEVMKRVEACRDDRLNAPDAGRRKLADRPSQFREIKNPDSFIVVPATSSERRRYVPMGFLTADTIATNAVLIVPNSTIFNFGVITSNIHMAWLRAVCGRLKSDYRYSKDIVYNNFPWPDPTDAQHAKIEQTAQAILDARALYPDSSLADLYDELTMPPELRKAHQTNDKAVWEAYGKAWKISSEADCVAHLMRLYQAKVEEMDR
jgi:hypothetical protein